jgi:hypothetical protein
MLSRRRKHSVRACLTSYQEGEYSTYRFTAFLRVYTCCDVFYGSVSVPVVFTSCTRNNRIGLERQGMLNQMQAPETTSVRVFELFTTLWSSDSASKGSWLSPAASGTLAMEPSFQSHACDSIRRAPLLGHREQRWLNILQVYDALVDFKSYSQWNPFIVSAAGEATVGSRLVIVVEPPGGKKMTFKPKVLVAERGKELKWLGRLLMPGLFDGEHSFKLESLPGVNSLHFVRLISSHRTFKAGKLRQSIHGRLRTCIIACVVQLHGQKEFLRPAVSQQSC